MCSGKSNKACWCGINVLIFLKSTLLASNKTGMSKVGAILKAQKWQIFKNMLWTIFMEISEKNSQNPQRVPFVLGKYCKIFDIPCGATWERFFEPGSPFLRNATYIGNNVKSSDFIEKKYSWNYIAKKNQKN